MATILDISSEELEFYPYSDRMMRHPPETAQYRGWLSCSVERAQNIRPCSRYFSSLHVLEMNKLASSLRIITGTFPVVPERIILDETFIRHSPIRSVSSITLAPPLSRYELSGIPRVCASLYSQDVQAPRTCDEPRVL